MKSLVKKLPLFLLVVAGLSLSSCYTEEFIYVDPASAELEIQVFGAISGVPREGIRVSLHESEYDAEHNINPIAGYAWTDYDGFVYFYGLPPGQEYYIRAKALLAKTIRSTPPLYVGYHFQTIPIL